VPKKNTDQGPVGTRSWAGYCIWA